MVEGFKMFVAHQPVGDVMVTMSIFDIQSEFTKSA